ncbi:MAG: tryptophan--tRNA ligase, partial [Elusimicrobia bacterium]|nr:tryptophan--tRNA ligase [Elusimicrobiota bacterium]
MSRVVSGMRPTGRLHLGNYFGALKNWIELSQRHGCRFFIADWHMLTTGSEETGALRENVRELVLELLAAGLDPARCLLFRQSDVPEHAELALLLGMVTPLSWLENNPTWKEQLQELSKTKMGKALSEQEEQVLAEEAVKTVKSSGGGPLPALKAAEKAIEKAEATAAQYEIRTYGFLGYPVLQAADILLYHGTKVPVGQDQLPHLELSREIARKFNNAFG